MAYDYEILDNHWLWTNTQLTNDTWLSAVSHPVIFQTKYKRQTFCWCTVPQMTRAMDNYLSLASGQNTFIFRLHLKSGKLNYTNLRFRYPLWLSKVLIYIILYIRICRLIWKVYIFQMCSSHDQEYQHIYLRSRLIKKLDFQLKFKVATLCLSWHKVKVAWKLPIFEHFQVRVKVKVAWFKMLPS